MNIDLEVQKGIRARLTTWAALMALVPPDHIRGLSNDRKYLPSILLGDSQAVDPGTSLRRAHTRVYHTLHVWQREESLEEVKEICGTIRTAIHQGGRLVLAAPLHCADVHVSSMRFLRDPDGEHSHGIVVVEVLVSEGRA